MNIFVHGLFVLCIYGNNKLILEQYFLKCKKMIYFSSIPCKIAVSHEAWYVHYLRYFMLYTDVVPDVICFVLQLSWPLVIIPVYEIGL